MKIQIPTPCHENWNEMNANEKGKFCKVCNKTVVDLMLAKNGTISKYI